MNGLKIRLSAMNFLEFAVWGAYLVSLGMFLGSVGLGDKVLWFYTVQGLVSLFMPGVVGMIADRYIPAQKMMSLCHTIAGAFMIAAGFYAMSCLNNGSAVEFAPLFTLYTVSVAFFMPTIGLNNSVAFSAMNQAGMDTVKEFPPIRIFGTIGFICAELFVNFVVVGHETVSVFDPEKQKYFEIVNDITIQQTFWQMFVSGGISILLAFYALTMPKCPTNRSTKLSVSGMFGLSAFKLFKDKSMAVFFIFSMLLGVSLQITNGYGTMYIEQFGKVAQFLQVNPDFFADNPTFLISISQASETLCILLIPFCLRKFGIKGVMLMAMIGWVLRFGFFGIGNTAPSGVWLLILSCIVYGVAFDFFNVSGGLYVDKKTSPEIRSSAQGLFMIMTNGIGASLGTFLAGTFVVNKKVLADGLNPVQQLDGWRESWLIFAAYALVVAILFWLIFRNPDKKTRRDKENEAEVREIASISDDPGGEIII